MDISTPGKTLPFSLTLEGSFDLQFQHLSGKVTPGGTLFPALSWLPSSFIYGLYFDSVGGLPPPVIWVGMA